MDIPTSFIDYSALPAKAAPAASGLAAARPVLTAVNTNVPAASGFVSKRGTFNHSGL